VKPPAVVVDIDNTLVDTAVRKRDLLRHLRIADADLAAVRKDFWLRGFLGEESSETFQKFFEQLETPETIETHIAPLFSGAKETIAWLAKRGVAVHYVTGRPASLRAATLAELRSHRLPVDDDMLHFSDRVAGPLTPGSLSLAAEAKARLIRDIAQRWAVLAVVGDQPEDAGAAAKEGVPGILLTSTTGVTGVRQDVFGAPSAVCDSWPEVAIELAQTLSGTEEIRRQRQQFVDNYVTWLGEIDSKSQTTILIAGALSALTTPVLTGKHFNFRLDWLLVLVLLLSILSMVYAIRSFTSRYTSGALTARAIPVKVKQWFAILLDWPASWKSVPNDALRDYETLKVADEATQARAHLQFFHERYRTRDPDALLNLRLYEMRAANYSKLYPERLASKLLVTAIALSAVWVVIRVSLFEHLVGALEWIGALFTKVLWMSN
jgi:phosphoglycolate phosphatase-like HAD superfamily hydrolase